MLQWSMRPEVKNASREDPPSPYSSGTDMDDYLQKIWNSEITKRRLDAAYHSKIAAFLYEGAASGFGGHVDEFSEVSLLGQTIEGIRDNIYIFSAAKQYQQVRIMSYLINEKGVRSSFSEFKKKAKVVFEEFNVNYLKTEYQTAVQSSIMARDWVQFETEKEWFPVLQYKTQEDARVRPEHAILDNIIRPVGDGFWDYAMPPNGWNCRCFVISLKEGEVSDVPPVNWGDKDFPTVFKMNPGKDKMIFKPDHPYVDVAKGDKGFKKKNFGMLIP